MFKKGKVQETNVNGMKGIRNESYQRQNVQEKLFPRERNVDFLLWDKEPFYVP